MWYTVLASLEPDGGHDDDTQYAVYRVYRAANPGGAFERRAARACGCGCCDCPLEHRKFAHRPDQRAGHRVTCSLRRSAYPSGGFGRICPPGCLFSDRRLNDRAFGAEKRSG